MRLLIISGPSGSGKSTLVRHLIGREAVPVAKSISATTRPARPGEVNGKDYFFLPKDEFLRRRAAGEFAETNEVHESGVWYGTLLAELQRIVDSGRTPLLEIDIQGGLRLLEEFKDTLSIFITTASPDEFRKRLSSRGSESPEQIAKRLETAERELQLAHLYSHQVCNDSLDRAVDEIVSLFKSHWK